MVFILDGTLGSDIDIFFKRLHEETLEQSSMMLYKEWMNHKHEHHPELSCNSNQDRHPMGIILLRVKPEIAHKRLQQHNAEISLDEIQKIYTQKEDFFIQNKHNHPDLQGLPILVLNGNIDFQTDFSQFYNHLFYIRRFINDIKKQQEVAQGIYQEKPIRKCC